MVDHKTGLVGLCKEKKNMNCLFYHSIIHQVALCRKTIRLSDTMKTIVNLIKKGKKVHRHRAFSSFLDNLEIVYGDISLYCECAGWVVQNAYNDFLS